MDGKRAWMLGTGLEALLSGISVTMRVLVLPSFSIFVIHWRVPAQEIVLSGPERLPAVAFLDQYR
jgi:hypothetical protein